MSAHKKIHIREKQLKHSVGKKTSFFHGEPQQGQIELKCHFCDEIFDISSIQAFQDHQLKHELKAIVPIGIGYVCFQCDATFDLASELIEHASTCTE